MMPPRLPVSLATTSGTGQDLTQGHSHIEDVDPEMPPPNTTCHKRRRRRQHSHSHGHKNRRRSWWSPGHVRLTLILLLSTACSVLAASSDSTSTSASTSTSTSASTPASESDTSGDAGLAPVQRSLTGCAPQHWWDSGRDRCIPCTRCQDEMIPLRPCQLHTDTICGSIYDLNIDWVVLAKTEPNWKERHKPSEYEHLQHANVPLQHLTHEQLQQLHEEATAAAWALDWQTGVLYAAVLTCLLFFSVAACILIHHMRQWRRMERRLDQDVEELSTKLMAKLAEVQSLDGGTFFIGNAEALRGLPASGVTHSSALQAAQSGIFQPQHVLLPEKRGKHQERRILKALQPGNVYIEESNGVMGHGLGFGGGGPKG
ncbi:hypothetical protein KR018_000685 [Drosophila ironensis]|nr:hypothetical protein KR018_000685 [Drosophila ironensis]